MLKKREHVAFELRRGRSPVHIEESVILVRIVFGRNDSRTIFEAFGEEPRGIAESIVGSRDEEGRWMGLKLQIHGRERKLRADPFCSSRKPAITFEHQRSAWESAFHPAQPIKHSVERNNTVAGNGKHQLRIAVQITEEGRVGTEKPEHHRKISPGRITHHMYTVYAGMFTTNPSKSVQKSEKNVRMGALRCQRVLKIEDGMTGFGQKQKVAGVEFLLPYDPATAVYEHDGRALGAARFSGDVLQCFRLLWAISVKRGSAGRRGGPPKPFYQS